MSSKSSKSLSRRQFLRITAGAAATTQFSIILPASLLGQRSPLSSLAAQQSTVAFWGWPTQITRSLDEQGKDKLAERILADTGVKLEVNLVDQPDLSPKLRAALPASTGPDV